MVGRHLPPVGVDRTLAGLEPKAFGVLPQSVLVLALLHTVIPLLFQTPEADFGSSLWTTE